MFGSKLDSLTLLFAISALGFVMAAIARSAAKAMPGYRRALRAWSAAMLAAGVGFFLFHGRGHLPWFLTFAVGNTLVMLVAAYGLVAHARLVDVRVSKALVALPLAVGSTGVIAVYAFAAPHPLAVAAISAAMAVLFGSTVILLARAAWARFRLLTAASLLVMAAMSAALVLRVFISAFGDPADIAPTATAAPQAGLFVLGLVYILTSSLWVLDTAHEGQRCAALEAGRRDGLTGLYTRTAFFEHASMLLGERRGAACAVVMLDIDHFKTINDTWGHAAGDATLAHAARRIASAVRLTDVVGRYGGEEFCLLLPDCDASQAAELAERLVDDAARQPVRLKDGQSVRFTLSAGYVATHGLAAVDDPMDLLSRLLEQADAALYRAKHEGRNRAVACATTGMRVASPVL